MPLLFSPVYSITHLLQLQSVFFFYLGFAWGVPLPYSTVEHAPVQPLLQAFPSPSTLGKVAPHPLSPSGLFICSGGMPLPHSPELRAPSPLCYVSFLFFSCLLIIQVFCLFVCLFTFFPGRGSVCPGGYADLSPEVPHAACLCTWWPTSRVGAGGCVKSL
jgi:hypothetical protein